MLIGIALIHAEEIAREERSLLAAGAGTHFQDRAFLVREILRQQLHLELAIELLDLLSENVELLLRKRRHRVVRGGIVDNLLQLIPLALGFAQRSDDGDDRIQLGELARQAHICFLVRTRRKRRLHAFPACDKLVELLSRNRAHDGIEAS